MRFNFVTTRSVFSQHAHFTSTKKTPKRYPSQLTTEDSNKSRATSMSCIDFLIQFLRCEMEREIDTMPIFLSGYTVQFRLTYVFCLFTEI